MKNAISIVIPTYNEAPNIRKLVTRLHTALTKAELTYELIFVDDNSTDGTRTHIKTLMQTYPISLYVKSGKKGKAFSLLEGFAAAKYKYVAMIDADLQYPPEAIPGMLQHITTGSCSIVVANRVVQKTSVLRQLASKINRVLLSKLMWDMDHDVQAGLKVFEKSVLDKISFNPTPWTFDLEFLVKARYYGALISNFDIEFAAREAGDTKINLLLTSPQIVLAALKLKADSFRGFASQQSPMQAIENGND